jgi:hypothetical protein
MKEEKFFHIFLNSLEILIMDDILLNNSSIEDIPLPKLGVY